MGEGENKAEEKKMEEKKAGEEKKEETKAEKVSEEKKEEKKAEETKDAAATPPPPPPPPQEIVLKVYMHCEGCAKKVRRCLKGFEGVEEVQTDCKAHKVVVKGEKADPVKVLERVQKKSHRQVELISPIPKPPPAEDKKKTEEKEVAKPEEKKEPQVITVILQVHMHCEACAQEIKRRILKMKGVENVEPDLKSSQVTVKGVFDPPDLVEYIHRRTGKHAAIVKQEPEKKEEEKGKEEKKADDGGDKKAEEAAKEKKEGGGDAVVAVAAEGGEEVVDVVELRKNEYYYNYPQHYQIYHPYELPTYAPAAPQMFSDENPNACAVM
ncbi:heavy metal-associated isoprenylated plant protein 7-like isoform X2 [Rhododendron vialii]|uniref:heavy metal-associated isoprenylated plant protein 7-like isoform X2 n=1 Tax=Rhododendron vialii TaxID=182163 RepID=UPI00265EE2E1|nr:heavy metal-associated isoprenylated plant protein 7-like isoform X2 [Rhododendron vialii]